MAPSAASHITPPASPPSAILPPGALACVVCGHGDTKKVSAVYGGGSWSARTTGQSYGIGQVWDGPAFDLLSVSSQQITGTSYLAACLAPPARPRGNSLGSCMAGCASIIAVAGLAGSLLLGWGGLCTLMLVLGIVFIGFGCAAQSADGRKTSEHVGYWMLQMSQWERLFYCPRCDHVYNPQTRQAAPSRNMVSLL